MLLELATPVPRIARIDIADVDTKSMEFLIEQPPGPTVDPVTRKQVVARVEYGQVCHCCRAHAAPKENGALCALQSGESLSDGKLVGVVAEPSIEHIFR